MYYLGFLDFIGFLVFSELKPSIKRSLILMFIGIFVVLIGIPRIYLGEHRAGDVPGSYLLGSLTLVAGRAFLSSSQLRPRPGRRKKYQPFLILA